MSPSLWGTTGTVGSAMFADGFRVEFVENVVANSSAFTLKKEVTEPSSAVNGGKG